MTQQYIDLSKLVKSSRNVRKTVSKSACEELKASILAHGLMQNLVVTAAKGKFHVIAGGRRLEALQALHKEGKLPTDFAAPCQVVDEEHAAEMSLAENVVRLAMHPADQFEAFAALIDKGQSTAQVAGRFGVAEKLVEQRMKLARVAPELLTEYRAEKLTLEALTAFTITDDYQKQLAVYESLSEWQLKHPNEIRDRLTDEMVESSSKLAAFVTLETYREAGGTTKTDLFGDDVYLENPELLDALVTEKLRLAEQELAAEGWEWVQVDRERDWKATQGCGRLEAEPVDAPQELMAELAKAEAEQRAIADQIDATEDDDDLDALYERDRAAEAVLDAVAEKLSACAKFDTEQMKTAGCYAYIDRNGKLEVEKGLLKRQDAKKAAHGAEGEVDDEQPQEKPKGLPESLKRDLEAYRLGVAQAEIAKHPAIAFDLLVFKAARNALTVRSLYDGPNVSFSRNFSGTASKDARDFIQTQMEPVAKALPVGWLKAETEAEQFATFQILPGDQKHALLAYCVATTLQPKLDEGTEPTAYDIALSQTGANVADYWRPTATNHLSRIRTGQLLEIGQEIFGGKFSTQYAKAKKGELVALLDKGFADPEKALDPEKVRRLENWLPQGMAFRSAEPAGKPTKAKKKAA